jgi:hypothetical protein
MPPTRGLVLAINSTVRLKKQASSIVELWSCRLVLRPCLGHVSVHQIVECRVFRSLELGELLRSVGSTPTLFTVSLQGIKESLEVML